jgi:hypothetical protein
MRYVAGLIALLALASVVAWIGRRAEQYRSRYPEDDAP